MGEVYRARDTRLDRAVAVKILPETFAGSAQLKARFEREAKTISQLNHPNICTLFDVGENYLVMELLEGETLADRLLRGPLPIEDVLRHGIQIAGALDKAHREGITHRDLKPGNVMLTKTGAKLLDFGLAKSAAPLTDLSGVTQQKALTQEGTIVGTFEYMAPEQLEGEEADARTDIFALGAVLYEMATGTRAFAGKTRTSLIAAIVTGRPIPLSQVQPLSPPALEHVIERCLEKDPADRWQSAHDVAEELKWISAKGSQAGVAAPVMSRRRTRERFAWALHLLTAAVAVAATLAFMELRKEPPRVIETTLLPPDKTQFAYEQHGAPALSPDGTRIVFPATSADGHTMLYVRRLSTGSAQSLAGTDDANSPFWSPDSRFIGFFVPGKLKKIDASGGVPQTVADAPQGRGGTWSGNGVIVFAPALSGPLSKVSDSGGVSTVVTHVEIAAGETTDRWPFFLPDGRHFVYLAAAPTGGRLGQKIKVGSVDNDSPKELMRATSNAAYADGYLVYARDQTLFAQRFDPKTLHLDPNAVPVVEGLPFSGRLDACFTVSGNGTLVYQAGSGLSVSRLLWLDATGKTVGQVGNPMNYTALALSHDGRRIATTIADPTTGHTDMWINDIARATSTRLTFDPGDEIAPVWSPDDSMLIYSSNAKSPGDIMMKRSSGTGSEQMIYFNPALTVPWDWSPDGKTITFHELDPNGKMSFDIWLYSLEDHKAHLFLQTPFTEISARFSPDGRWIVYHSNESGRNEVYVLPVSGEGGKRQISADGGDRARFSRDGKHIFYIAPDHKLMMVDVSANGSDFTAGIPHPLFLLNMKRVNGNNYDVSLDGTRFLVNTPVEQTQIEPLTLVQNWPAALNK